MREIKFRAWHGFKKYWIHDDTYGCDILGETILFGGWMENIGIEELNDVVVEQFTGLRDKNGKEIYEGDIVIIDSGYGGDYHYPDCIADIRYNWCNFYPHNNKDKDGCVLQDYSWDKDMEVIGNIHENPELMNE